MNTQQAISTLISAVQVAQQKGAFNLNDAKIIAEAVEVFIKKPEEEKSEPEKTKEPKAKK